MYQLASEHLLFLCCIVVHVTSAQAPEVLGSWIGLVVS
jgi:hypothetical protein